MSEGEAHPTADDVMLRSRKRLVLLTLLCLPGLFTGGTLGLDNFTTIFVGASFTSRGFLGGLVGLAAFFLGYASILAWPGVAVVGTRAIRDTALRPIVRLIVALACVVATYTALFWFYWFVLIQFSAARRYLEMMGAPGI